MKAIRNSGFSIRIQPPRGPATIPGNTKKHRHKVGKPNQGVHNDAYVTLREEYLGGLQP